MQLVIIYLIKLNIGLIYELLNNHYLRVYAPIKRVIRSTTTDEGDIILL